MKFIFSLFRSQYGSAVLALLCFLIHCALAGCNYQPQGAEAAAGAIDVPLDGAWETATFLARDGSRYFGALGIRSVTPGVHELNVEVDFVKEDPDRGQGMVLRYLEDIQAFGRVVDLVGAKVSVLANGHGPVRAQVVVETENADGITARQYGPWNNLFEKGSQQIFIEINPIQDEPLKDTEPGFDPERVRRLGIRISPNKYAPKIYKGTITITGFKIELPSEEVRQQLKAEMQAVRKTKPDDETLKNLPPLASPISKTVVLPMGNRLSAETDSVSVKSIVERTAPNDPQNKVWEVLIRFEEHQPQVLIQRARVIYGLKTPLDLTRKRVTAWAAIGPALRGAMPHPNLVILELYDTDGRMLRGPAGNLSMSGMAFSPDGLESSSRWVKMEAAPVSGIPVAMGYIQPGFRPDKVQQIGVSFEVGRFSHLLRKEPYPLTGKLLLSEVRVEDNPHQPGMGISFIKRSPVKKDPAPIEKFMVGINYPWINYGWDVGISPYDGRDIGGFSSRRYKLERDFALFKEKGIRLVRVFLLADLRTGLVYDEDGKVTGLDKYVTADIDALVSVAAKNGIRLIPVLLDFTVADGMSELDLGFPFWRWKLGEAPQFIVGLDQRDIFLHKALRPIILQLARVNEHHPGLIYAIDIVNEVEHALEIITPNHFVEVVAFIRKVRDMIRSEAPGLPITLGSRNRDELVNFWGDLGLDIWQYHHYGRITDEENRPLLLPAGDLGLAGPILIGEIEPSDIEQSLDMTYNGGYDGALFWSYAGVDGFVVDLDAIKRWVEKKTLATGGKSGLK